MAKYDVHRVFEDIPKIMGLELVRRGDHWEGGYYMNGDRHRFRKDKLKVAKWNNDIWVHEEGGESQSITTWLQNYGGAADFWAAVDILKGCKRPLKFDGVFRKKENKELTVSRDVYDGAMAYDYAKCNLFRWMAGLFGEEKVRDAWRKYGVSTDNHGNAVFWFVDVNGRILHDKRMAYLENGHRNREFGAWRKFTMAKGYTGKCFFGANLWKDAKKVYVCESEKTALLFYLYYGKPIIATGGKNALTEVDDHLVLVPDMDAREEWEEKGTVWKWWKNFTDVGDHDDIGDAIVRRILYNKK